MPQGLALPAEQCRLLLCEVSILNDTVTAWAEAAGRPDPRDPRAVSPQASTELEPGRRESAASSTTTPSGGVVLSTAQCATLLESVQKLQDLAASLDASVRALGVAGRTTTPPHDGQSPGGSLLRTANPDLAHSPLDAAGRRVSVRFKTADVAAVSAPRGRRMSVPPEVASEDEEDPAGEAPEDERAFSPYQSFRLQSMGDAAHSARGSFRSVFSALDRDDIDSQEAPSDGSSPGGIRSRHLSVADMTRSPDTRSPTSPSSARRQQARAAAAGFSLSGTARSGAVYLHGDVTESMLQGLAARYPALGDAVILGQVNLATFNVIDFTAERAEALLQSRGAVGAVDPTWAAFMVVVLNVLLQYSFVGAFDADLHRLMAFADAVFWCSSRRHQFHTALKAADALHAAHLVLLQPHVHRNLTDLDLCAVLLSALLLDVGHLGVTNDFLVRVGHPLAAVFGVVAPAEHASVAVATALLRDPRTNFFGAAWWRGDAGDGITHEMVVLEALSQLLLASSPRDHGQLLAQATQLARTLRLRAQATAQPTVHSEPFLDAPTEESTSVTPSSSDNVHSADRQAAEFMAVLRAFEVPVVLAAIVHAADVAFAMKPPRAFMQWVNLRRAEHLRQGDEEEARGLVPSFFARRDADALEYEHRFLAKLVLPLLDGVPVFPRTWRGALRSTLLSLQALLGCTSPSSTARDPPGLGGAAAAPPGTVELFRTSLVADLPRTRWADDGGAVLALLRRILPSSLPAGDPLATGGIASALPVHSALDGSPPAVGAATGGPTEPGEMGGGHMVEALRLLAVHTEYAGREAGYGVAGGAHGTFPAELVAAVYRQSPAYLGDFAAPLLAAAPSPSPAPEPGSPHGPRMEDYAAVAEAIVATEGHTHAQGVAALLRLWLTMRTALHQAVAARPPQCSQAPEHTPAVTAVPPTPNTGPQPQPPLRDGALLATAAGGAGGSHGSSQRHSLTSASGRSSTSGAPSHGSAQTHPVRGTPWVHSPPPRAAQTPGGRALPNPYTVHRRPAGGAATPTLRDP